MVISTKMPHPCCTGMCPYREKFFILIPLARMDETGWKNSFRLKMFFGCRFGSVWLDIGYLVLLLFNARNLSLDIYCVCFCWYFRFSGSNEPYTMCTYWQVNARMSTNSSAHTQKKKIIQNAWWICMKCSLCLFATKSLSPPLRSIILCVLSHWLAGHQTNVCDMIVVCACMIKYNSKCCVSVWLWRHRHCVIEVVKRPRSVFEGELIPRIPIRAWMAESVEATNALSLWHSNI